MAGRREPSRRTVRAAALAALLLAAACAPPTQPFRDRTEAAIADCDAPIADAPPARVSANGRSAMLIAPTTTTDDPAPLLVSLHPFVMGPRDWEDYSGLAKAAADRGYWVLLPKGSDPGPRWAVPGGLDGGPDDIGWIDALIAETATIACIDSARIFAAGFSAGAAMAVGLSCELPWRFAAIAASGGANLTLTCPDAPPVSALILHGTADPIAPLTGSQVIFAPPLGLPVAEVVASFADRNGCGDTSTERVVSDTVTADIYDCEDAHLEYWAMHGAGHTWAGANVLLDAVTGSTDQTFSATDSVLDYFDAIGE